jgi:hypothetical protein
MLACLVLLLVVLRFTGLEPRDRTPGLWLEGNVVSTAVADWSFTDKVPTIKLQTRTRYLLPHSVTINFIAYNHHLHVASVFPAGTSRHWNEDVMRDPRVRIKIGDQLYDRRLSRVTDPAEKQAVLEARAEKYPRLKIHPNDTVRVFRVLPRPAA